MLCSEEFLEDELETIKSIFYNNGYPEGIVRRTIQRKIDHFNQGPPLVQAPEKYPVYLRLPYIGQMSDHHRKKITNIISRTYHSVNPRVIFTSKTMLPSSIKDVLPSHERSQPIYLFKCSCESTYVGRTNQRLSSRIRQHIPSKVEKTLGSRAGSAPETVSSAIANHLIQNTECGKNFEKQMFTILCHGRSHFHLQALEALNISLRKPPLCQQKKFVHSMILFKHLGSGL